MVFAVGYLLYGSWIYLFDDVNPDIQWIFDQVDWMFR